MQKVEKMGLYILAASILLQLAAVVIASMIAWTTLRRSWILIALAVTFMALRRSISLYQGIVLDINIDPIAESVALLISVLMLGGFAGLFLRERSLISPPNTPSARSASASTRSTFTNPGGIAVFLGILIVLATSVVGYLSYATSRTTLIETIRAANLRTVQSFSRLADSPDLSLSVAERTKLIDGLWATAEHRYADSYMCIINAAGELITHTRSRSMEGLYVGDFSIRDEEHRFSDIDGLLASETDWVGWYVSDSGEEQIAAFSYSEELSSLVAIHVPMKSVEREIFLETLPLAIGLVFVLAILLPAALGVLYRAYSATLRKVESSEAQYRAIVEDQTELICRNLQDGTLTFVNEAYCRYFNKKSDDLVGNKFLPLIPEEDRLRVQEHFASLNSENPTESHEHRVIAPNGEIRWMRWTNRAILDDVGSVMEFQGTGRDITDQKLAEEASHRSMQIVTTSSSMLAMLDTDFRYVAVNEAYAKALGKTPQEIIGRTPGDVFGQEVFESLIEPNAKQCMAGEDVRYQAWMEFPSYGRRFMDIAYSPHRNKAGQIEGVIVNSNDITERKQAEEALEQREQHFRLFSLSTADSFWNWDMVSATVERSTGFEQVFGYEEQDVDSSIEWWVDRIHPDDRDRVLKTFEEAIAGTQDTCGYQYRFRRNDDSYATVDDHVCLIRDETGTVIRSLGAMSDVSHELELEQQLMQAQKLESLGTLAGGIAHDFNNIIHAILGFSKIASENLNGNREILVQCLEGIEGGGERARDLIDQILTFSRKTEVELEPLKLQPLIEEARRFLRSSIPTTIQIDLKIDPDCGHVAANATQIHQVVTNLCTNAMHAMEDGGGTLSITLDQMTLESSMETLSGRLDAGDYIRLSVIDTGTGIDSASMEHVLDPFYTTKEVGKGTGLGLAMVHGIVKGMSGGLVIESKLGKGTTIRMLLPVFREREARERPKNIPKCDLTGSGHIMIVDDEEAITKVVTILLESRGFTVEPFNDVASALEAAKAGSRKFDVAILDHMMPGKTGIELARDFESLIPDTTVILATGMMDWSELEQHKSQNIVSILKKPFGVEVLIAAINQTHQFVSDLPRPHS